MDDAKHITDISQILNISFKGFKVVREVASTCVFDKNIQLIDIKLDVFGPQEDMYYSTLPELV